MPRLPSSPSLVALFVALLWGCAHQAHGQMTDGALSPAGRLSIEVLPSFQMWDHRFGVHDEGGLSVTGSEPLGFDLENEPILPIRDLEQGLRTALADPSLALVLGSARALVSRERTRVSFGLALGVFDWLTIRADVPLVKARTEIAFDFRTLQGANLGTNPRLLGDGRVTAFLGALDASRNALQAHVSQQCPGATECGELTDLLDRYATFAGGLATAYADSPVFLTGGSAGGIALEQRLASFRTEVDQRAPGVAMPGAAPLANAPLDQSSLTQLLANPAAGFLLVNPLNTSAGLWRLGDIGVSASFRLLESAPRDSAGAPAPFQYQVGGRALVRLPTGLVDNPDVPLDLGTGDGQMDLEVSGFMDLRWKRTGLRGEVRYGVQRPTDLVRRVAPPEVIMAPFATRTLVRWTPGNYTEIELAPRWHMTDEFAVGALYRRASREQDSYRLLTPATSPSASASDLERETKETLHELGLGLAFSTLATWREGRAPLPFDARMAVRGAVSGGGGAVPDGIRMELSVRVFWRLWGSDPEPAP